MSNLPIIVTAATELLKLILQSYFAYARIAGIDPEQMDMMYQGEKQKFLSKKPENLPDR